MQAAALNESPSEPSSRFNRHADRLLERHGRRVWRVGVDGGFGCPNRRGGRGGGGCSYCAPAGGAAPYLGDKPAPLDEQLSRAVTFLKRRYGAEAFFLYFQAYSSTNAEPDRLRAIYDEGLAWGRGRFRGLVVSTRPDCIDEEKAELLASYAARGLEVWVELGLQSAHERTLTRIRRGHGPDSFIRARRLLELPGLRTAAHLMLGLPGESRAEMLDSLRFLQALGIDGIKFHDLQLALGSELAEEYPLGELSLLQRSGLPALLADCIELLNPRCEVIRLCADLNPRERLAPRRVMDKEAVYRELEGELARRGRAQGWRVGLPAQESGRNPV